MKKRVIHNLNELKGYQPPKYGNAKLNYHGITFDSKAEYAYYRYLALLKSQGIIKSFSMQVKFPLVESFKHPTTGKTIRGINYIADYEVIYSNGTKRVIDVKGKRTEVFNIKAKLFIQRYQIPLVIAVLNYNTNQFNHEEVYG